MPILTDKLTRVQADVLLFYAGHFAAHQRFPTHMEVCARFGWSSPHAVWAHLAAMEKKGYVRTNRDKGRPAKSRAIEIVGLADAIGPAVLEYVARLIGEELK